MGGARGEAASAAEQSCSADLPADDHAELAVDPRPEGESEQSRPVVTLSQRPRRALKSSYLRLLNLARVDRLLLAARARQGDPLVLNLHRVSPEHRPYWPTLAPEAFRGLVEFLDRTCDVVTFGELADSPLSGRPRVVLSFDDGCRDFVEYVMPILDQYGMRANQNVIVQSVETGRPPWLIAVLDALGAASAARVRGLNVPGFPHHLEGTDDRSKERFGILLAKYLSTKSPGDRDYLCSDINELLGDTSPDDLTSMMSLADTRAIADLHELGGHSYSHEPTALLSDVDFVADVDRCRALFALLGKPMNVFAFPYGSYRPEQIKTLRGYGVKHILVMDGHKGVAVSGAQPRTSMYGETGYELRLRAVGWTPPSWSRSLAG